MRSCCERWEKAASRHENIGKSLTEIDGGMKHGLRVKNCPKCDEFIGKNLEDFVAEGCYNENCKYEPKISFEIDNQ